MALSFGLLCRQGMQQQTTSLVRRDEVCEQAACLHMLSTGTPHGKRSNTTARLRRLRKNQSLCSNTHTHQVPEGVNEVHLAGRQDALCSLQLVSQVRYVSLVWYEQMDCGCEQSSRRPTQCCVQLYTVRLWCYSTARCPIQAFWCGNLQLPVPVLGCHTMLVSTHSELQFPLC